jgi:phosphoribosylglycinamide formyltransferase-1
LKRKGAKIQIAVFCSGFGSNLEALLKAEKAGSLKAEISLVVCDRPDSFTLVRANQHKKQAMLVESRYFASKQSFEESIVRILEKKAIDLVVLAGFMKILSPYFINKYKGRILNIHPSLLPAFKGAHAIEDAFAYGSKVTGVTVHFVTDALDDGPIILQEAVLREERDTEDKLEAKIHKVEHALYAKAIRFYAEGRLKIRGRKVVVSGYKR